jgi:hypothetical protein
MTTKPNPLSYLNFWQEASELEFGLLVEMASEDDKRNIVNALYECRKQSGGFENMIIMQPTTTMFYIMKKTVEMPE